MKIIALLVHDDDGQEARLQVALDIARAVNGHLTCIDVAVPVPAGVPFGEVTPVLTTAILEREGANRARIEARLEAEIISSDWVEMVGDIATSLVQILVGTAGKTLLAHIERLRASYLVMGGFGHSRARERLLAG